MTLRDFKTVAGRRKALEKQLKVSLANIGRYSIEEAVASTRNCENMIGAAQVPIGIAGPLRLAPLGGSRLRRGSRLSPLAFHDYYVPMATTEGALVASVNRGCKAITESGGAVVDSYRVGATRGPVFRVENLKQSDKLNRFLEEHFTQLKKVAQSTSHHLTLKRFISRGVGRYRYVRFVYDTQDAMGMNMVTIATDAIVSYIKRATGVACIALSGNYCVDKKPSWLNIIEGRGTKVWAEVTIPEGVLRKTLKTTARQAYEVWLAKCFVGSAMAGSMSYNAHFANTVAAIFIATGQDAAHVGEGSLGITTAEIVLGEFGKREDLYVSVYLPDLMVGTVGGGTGLATQKEALSILGVAGGNNGRNAQKFAEIIGAAVLAGEISLLSSLEEGSLARAHAKLAKGK